MVLQNQLLAACKAVADQIAKLVQGVKGSLANPDSPAAQLSLISASEEFIQVATFSHHLPINQSINYLSI